MADLARQTTCPARLLLACAYTPIVPSPIRGFRHGLRSSFRTLFADGLPHLWQERPEVAGVVAGSLAQLRRHHADLHAARYPAHRVRSRHYALRSREQLRAAVRQRGDEFRAAVQGRFPSVSRRITDFVEGGVGHVAGAVWAGRRIAEIRAGVA